MKIITLLFLLVVLNADAQKLKPASYYMGHSKISKEAKLFYKKLSSFEKNKEGYYQNPNIEEITSSIMDSVFTKNNETRPFYLHLINRNSKLADGALMMSSILNQYKIIQTQSAIFFRYMIDNPIEKKNYYNIWASNMSSFSDQYCFSYLQIPFDSCLGIWRRGIMALLADEKSEVLQSAHAFFGLMKIADDLAPALIIGAGDNNKTFQMSVGNRFEIRFRECRGCASVWENIKIDKTSIKFTSEEYSNPSCTDCTGGNHDHHFSFEVVGKGISVLSFTYFSERINIFIAAQ